MPNATVSGIGKKLCSTRKEQQLSIEEVAWRTRIRPEYLRALEHGRFDAIGHDAFVRSHLSSYARTLGLDPAPILEEFESAGERPAFTPLKDLDRRERLGRKQRPKFRWIHAGVTAGVILILAGAFGLLGSRSTPPAKVSAVATSPRLDRPQTAGRDAVQVQHTAAPATSVAPNPLVVEIRASRRVWVRVVVDGKPSFEGILASSDRRTFQGSAKIEVLAGMRNAIQVLLNGSPYDLPAGSANGTVYAEISPAPVSD